MKKLNEMTQDMYDLLKSGVCDPHCHACGTPIMPKSLWGLADAGAHPVMPHSRISGMVCSSCFEDDDAEISPSERERMRERVVKALDMENPKPGQTPRGAIFDERGLVFPGRGVRVSRTERK